jgi:hypothetical protein
VLNFLTRIAFFYVWKMEGKLFTLQSRWVGHEAIAVAYLSLAVVKLVGK